MYGNDSFFTLTFWEGMGLAVLSIALAGGMVALVLRLPGPRLGRAVAALAALWLFVWLSPQVYYGYYYLIFEGLPVQIVVKSPPGPVHIARLLTFTEEHSLSRHGQGVLGWLLIFVAWRRKRMGESLQADGS